MAKPEVLCWKRYGECGGWMAARLETFLLKLTYAWKAWHKCIRQWKFCSSWLGQVATIYFVSHGRLKASKLAAVLETFSYQMWHIWLKLGTREWCCRNFLRREWGLGATARFPLPRSSPYSPTSLWRLKPMRRTVWIKNFRIVVSKGRLVFVDRHVFAWSWYQHYVYFCYFNSALLAYESNRHDSRRWLAVFEIEVNIR